MSDFAHLSTAPRQTVLVEKFAQSIIVEGWEGGRPLTVEMLELRLRDKFPSGSLQASFPASCEDDFFDSYFGDDHNCKVKYDNWRKDMLKRIGYSNLKVREAVTYHSYPDCCYR